MAKTKKAGILPKNGGSMECAPMVCHKEPNMPRRFDIEEADGGFIIRPRGGKLGWSDKQVVAKDLDDVTTRMREYFGKAKKGEEA